MDRLIRDVLSYSRILKDDFRCEPIDAGRLLQEIVTSYPAFSSDVASIEVTGSMPLVMGNAAALTQVFSNLLSNGIKFVAAGVKPHIRVSAESGGDFVPFRFDDNGIGVDPSAHAKIFGMFQRLHSEKELEGTGIGLTIVKKAIERMGGRVGLESLRTGGSRFWIELPPATSSDISN